MSGLSRIDSAERFAEVLALLDDISATVLEQASRVQGHQMVDHQLGLLSKAFTVVMRSSECFEWTEINFCVYKSGVCTLVGLLASKNKYVCHSAKRLLVALSNCLEVSVSPWKTLLEFLWGSAKIWVAGSTVSMSVVTSEAGSRFFDVEIPVPVSSQTTVMGSESLETRTTTVTPMNWAAAMCTLELLRCILKCVVGKDENTEAFLRVFLSQSVNVRCVHASDNTGPNMTCACLSEGASLSDGESFAHAIRVCMTASSSVPAEVSQRELLLASWLQLLSSVMRSLNSEQKSDVPGLHYACMKHIGSLIPTLSSLALSLHTHVSGTLCISDLLRHKMLTVLMRFCDWFSINHSVPLACLAALRSNAGDILNASLLQDDEFEVTQSCGPSPFALKKGGAAGQSCHFPNLQRRVLVLFFKIVCALSKEGAMPEHDRSAAVESNDSWMQERDPACFKQLEADLMFWLQAQLQAIGTSDSVMGCDAISSSDSKDKFARSFVHFFGHEDDLLLEMLLQLFVLAPILQLSLSSQPSLPEAAEAVSAIAPLRLYHAFLALVHYDPSVLMDFLISAQTGLVCIQYLMRCFRMISDTWPLFLECAPCVAESPEPTPAVAERAIGCMSQLKVSIERLHRRQLFPYNPAPLLRRLRMLEGVEAPRRKEGR